MMKTYVFFRTIHRTMTGIQWIVVVLSLILKAVSTQDGKYNV